MVRRRQIKSPHGQSEDVVLRRYEHLEEFTDPDEVRAAAALVIEEYDELSSRGRAYGWDGDRFERMRLTYIEDRYRDLRAVCIVHLGLALGHASWEPGVDPVEELRSVLLKEPGDRWSNSSKNHVFDNMFNGY